MKKRFLNIFMTVCSAAAVFACARIEELESVPQKERVAMTFSAVVDDQEETETKTLLDGKLGNSFRQVLWQPGDTIGIRNDYDNFRKFVNTQSEPSSTGSFSGEIYDSYSNHVAFYPYSQELESGHNGLRSVWHYQQSVQIFHENSFAPSSMPMIAWFTRSQSGTDMKFRNVFGVLAVNITGSETIKSVSFSGLDASGQLIQVAGHFMIDINSNAKDVSFSNASIDGNKTALSTVTLDCGDGVALDPSTPTPFYIALPPATYNSFNLVISTTDGKVMLKHMDKPLTIKRANVTKTASLPYVEVATVDISITGRSNCYQVTETGIYSFDATTIGNGEFGIVEGANFHTKDTKIQPVKAELLWEDRSGIIGGVTFDGKRITFLALGTEGNALIAAKDAEGKILWSWHIWVTDQPEEHVYVNDRGTFTMLDRNIGATRNDRGTGEEWREAQGMRYQWGRKDPFAENKYDRLGAQLSPGETILYPNSFITNYDQWMPELNQELWSTSQKTIYDPCPVGYRVPVLDVWKGFTENGENVDRASKVNAAGAFDHGWNFVYDNEIGKTAWYPTSTNTNIWADWYSSESEAYYWSANHPDYQANCAYFFAFYYNVYSDNPDFDCWVRYNEDAHGMGNALAVRCMKDEGHVDTSYPTVKVKDVVDVTSESAVVVASVTDEGVSEVTERGIIWGLDDNLTVDIGTKVVADVAGGGEYRTTLSGLQNATIYYVRPYAINSRGLSYGKVSSFRTTYAGEANNLSAYGTSNCYIVDPAYCKHYINGSVKGCGYESIGSVASVEVIWETNGYGMRTDPGTVIFDVTLKDGNIYFYTNGVEGNALVASKDAMGTILWSWHIWVTDAPVEQLYNGYYWVLDRNIGAVSAEEGTGEQWKLSCGLPFQRGRKDPFVSGTFTETYAYYSMEDAIAHPTVYDSGWNTSNITWSWSEKTIYDPCPVGYRMAVNSVWDGISRKGTDNGHGVYFYFDNDPSIRYWYPFQAHHRTDYIEYRSSGRLVTVDSGYYWDSDNNLNSGESYGQVRCMKDEGYVDMSYPIVKMNVTTDISSTGATLNAEITNTGIAEITSRGFIWGTSADLTPENGTKVECGAGSGKFSKALEGLAHSTRYYVMAYATNERGTSYSNVTSFFSPYEGSAVNLSRNGTANCYIVPVAYSEYAFNASVKGNSDEPVGDIAEAMVLWESRNDRNQINVGDVIDPESVCLEGNNVHFKLPFDPKSGNAVIAVKDALGTILWSWHIWVVDYDPVATQQKYISGAVMMDRNLGALNVIPGDLGSFGLMYQWGRKDPFMGSGVTWNDGWMRAYTAPSDAIRYEYFNSSNDTIENAVKNPTVVYDDARWNEANDLWGYKKTMYDPCPAGWRVSDLAAWEGLVKSGDPCREYIAYPEPYSTPAAYFPTSGYTSGEEYISHIYHGAYFWLTEHRKYVDMWYSRNHYLQSRDVDYLHSVRCMKDDPDKNGDNEDYTEGDDYEWND